MTYHLDCCNIPEKIFYLMTKDKKIAWKCNNCITKPKPLYENITVRNKTNKYTAAIPTENSFEALSSLSSNDNDDVEDDGDDTEQQCIISPSMHNRSCPERTMIYDKAENLENKILELQEKLEIADNEIVNLLSENYTLKDRVKAQDNIINHLKRLSVSTSQNNSCKQKRKSVNRGLNQNYLDHSGDHSDYNSLIMNKNNSINTSKTENVRNHQQTSIPNPIGMSTPVALPQTSHIQTPAINPLPLPTSVPKENCFLHQPRKPIIYIFGDEQVRGLSRSLLNSRRGKWNDIYDVRAVVKPYASSSHILNDLTQMAKTITKNDLIVLSVGCNDNNPFMLLTNICNMLYKFRDNNVLLFNIRKNIHLNTDSLNYDLEWFTKNYSNCTLINIKDQKLSWNSIVFKLNVEIDFLNYRREFLESMIKSRKLHNCNPIANDNIFFRQ